jgi:nucleoside-diphosphate-sugar epimerase
MKTYFITGATGYLGRHVIAALVRKQKQHPNEQIRIFGLSREGDLLAKHWRSIEGDLMLPGLPRLLEEIQPDVIFHFAAAHPTEPMDKQLYINVMGTRHLLQALVETQQMPTVVIPGSAAEYGLQSEPVEELTVPKPDTEWGVVKLAQTQTALQHFREFHLPVVVGRIFQVYGQSASNVWVAPIASQIARAEKKYVNEPRIRVKNLLAKRDLIHVTDVANALVAISEKGRMGEIYNIAHNEAVSEQDVLELLLRRSKLRNVEIEPVGEPLADLSQGRINKIDIHTGWLPSISLEQGLASELEYWREQASLLTVDPEDTYPNPYADFSTEPSQPAQSA